MRLILTGPRACCLCKSSTLLYSALWAMLASLRDGCVVQEQQEKNLVLKARLAQLNETLSSVRSRDNLMRSPKQLLETC